MLHLLSPTERLVLEHLPCAPNGLSVQELADGLLGDASPHGRAAIRSALGGLARLVGGLAYRRGNDDLGHADVELCGIPRDAYPLVRRLFAQGAPQPGHDGRTAAETLPDAAQGPVSAEPGATGPQTPPPGQSPPGAPRGLPVDPPPRRHV